MSLRWEGERGMSLREDERREMKREDEGDFGEMKGGREDFRV